MEDANANKFYGKLIVSMMKLNSYLYVYGCHLKLLGKLFSLWFSFYVKEATSE